MYEKPLPIPDVETASFWSALRDRRLLVKKCSACESFHFYPRVLCPHCHSDRVDWVEASGRGEIYTYTVARRPAGPSFKNDVPYVVALVKLDEGPRMMTNIVCDDPDAVRIGKRVVVDFCPVTDEITLPKFRLEEASNRSDRQAGVTR
jgi:uncharacterized OB-fold protein